MKVLEVIPTLDSGGAERFVVDLSNELSKTTEVVLVVLFPLDQYNYFLKEVSDRISIISLNKRFGFDVSCLYKLLKIIIKEKPQSVHSHLGAINYLVLSMLFLRHTKYFHTIHNDAHVEAGGYLSKLIRRFVFKCSLCTPITISDISRTSFTNAYKLPSVLILNGRSISNLYTTTNNTINTDIKNAKLTKNTKLLLNVARIESQKNQFMLCTCIAQLVKEGHDIALIIIGRKSDKKIISQIEELQCPNIFLIGERDNPREYMLKCDAFCLSSLNEGMPITIIEAYSVGAIPICTPVGGIPNMIIHGQNGLLSKNVTTESYKEVIKAFLNLSTNKINLMKKSSRDSYENYTMEKCAIEYKKIFS